MTNSERERLILEACEKAKAEGWTIRPNFWVWHDAKKCCPIGAIGVTSKRFVSLAAMDRLMVDSYWLGSFAAGFDGDELDRSVAHRDDAYALGRKLRRKLLGGDGK